VKLVVTSVGVIILLLPGSYMRRHAYLHIIVLSCMDGEFQIPLVGSCASQSLFR